MNIVGARVDERLVHGQVANLWTPQLQVERIIVLDEKAAKDDIQKSGLRMATPMSTKLSVLPTEIAADHLKKDRYRKQRVFLVAKKPDKFLDLLNMGIKLDTINVGNMSKQDDTTELTKQVNINEHEADVFREISGKGVNLIAQLNPSVESRDLMKLINEKMK
ncbi:MULTISPECIES: PTS system mannose/fructose/N-acetylgalactosamine-transporter subunit IIB [Lactobacillus]|uniref:PTS system mannose/fructose/N-acetylgalactosamine-transporter subunit IIB n=1 Tax=Lactobacillus TaxID=1578 RepID=UPI001650C335|nr:MULTISPECIES: PTS sugar transporter subunit IIB [Lactobacillus]MEB3364174.1 PTS sugar transporter subunit IIB [Lactobacillus sp. R2/2]MBC6350142.1 PTS mannose/fructose/sorbose transporter subunit IIB [Lactobacillus melliventris]MBH9990261.1 PTS sugar transporter subunit IIB [Lactobacillus sp. M0392]MBI0024659.1 PTS sugar transporter subunit IIB [Lactobacillus sp. W8171]MBI0045293.1 PTS sugar transporter subunit IIB [Lactobacillus sp. M0393]